MNSSIISRRGGRKKSQIALKHEAITEVLLNRFMTLRSGRSTSNPGLKMINALSTNTISCIEMISMLTLVVIPSKISEATMVKPEVMPKKFMINKRTLWTIMVLDPSKSSKSKMDCQAGAFLLMYLWISKNSEIETVKDIRFKVTNTVNLSIVT